MWCQGVTSLLECGQPLGLLELDLVSSQHNYAAGNPLPWV